LLLVTHSGAPSASEKKFWRNVGEIAEAKVLLATPPIVGSILFDTSVKESLRQLEPLVGDFYIEVPELPRGSNLLALADEMTHAQRTPEECLAFVKHAATRRRDVANGISDLVSALRRTVTHYFAEPKQTIWAACRRRLAERHWVRLPNARSTSVRRGLAKLLIPANPASVAESVGRVLHSAPEYLKALGFVGPSIRGDVVRDNDIIQAVTLLGKPAVKTLIADTCKDPAYEAIVKPLRVMAITAQPMATYVRTHWHELQTAAGLFKHLKQTHASGAAALGLSGDVYVRPGWLFILLSAVLKAFSGKRQAFGYAKLIKSIQDLTRATRNQIMELGQRLKLAGPHTLRGARTIEYGLRDWFFGEDRTNFDLREVELLATSHIVSGHLAVIDVSYVQQVVAKAQEMECQDLIENVLIPFNKFQPLKLLLKQRLLARGVTFEDVAYFPSPVYQRLVAEGRTINVRASSTSVLKVKDTVVRWISVSDEGKDHKRKEFGGRATMLPIEWSSGLAQYQARSAVKRLLLLVDGTFKDADLSVLSRLGWDGIYYADEVDQLCSDII
jgi:hypothetical protein